MFQEFPVYFTITESWDRLYVLWYVGNTSLRLCYLLF